MSSLLISWSTFFLSGVVFWLAEIRYPLHQIKYTAVFFKEFGAAVISILFTIILVYLFIPLIQILTSQSIHNSVVWAEILLIPLWLKIVIAYLLKDLSFYLAHRAMHANKFMWLTHKWHHSIEQLWWLAAARTSFVSRLIFKLGFLWFLLLGIPPEVMILVAIHVEIHQNWVHLNLKWHPWMGVLELIYVTPRFHSSHHFSRSQIQGKNLGGIFTVFDRLFGTYLDPSTLEPDQEKFSLGDEPINLRMIVGV